MLSADQGDVPGSPTDSPAARHEARVRAQAAATFGDWLFLVLQHHVQIEAAFAAVKYAFHPAARIAAQKKLATLLTAHANAEESVLYPTMVREQKGHAVAAYAQQATAKAQMAELENMTPLSPEYRHRLEHIRAAVAHHVYEEEAIWFIDLKNNTTVAEQAQFSLRYKEEFERSMGVVRPP